MMEIKFENRRQFLEQAADLFIVRRQLDQAAQAVEMLMAEFPIDAKLLLFKVRVFDLCSDYQNVIADGEKALSMSGLSPKDSMMLHNIIAMAYDNIGSTAKAAEHYRASTLIDLRSIEDKTLRAELIDDRREDYSNYLFALHRLPSSAITDGKLFTAVKNYDKLYTGIKRFKHKPHARERIRIGYVSPDLRAHVAGYFAAAFFTHHDRDRFEVIGYAACTEDEFSETLKQNADGWRNIKGDAPSTAAQKIFDDELDILIDLSGHTSHNCLPILAYKPAPVQISGVGWIGSTGFRAVDYFLVDRYTVPDKRGEKFFTEKLIRLPHSHFCYRPHGDVESGEAPCRANGVITFGSFNNFSKVTDEQLRLWSKIMSAVDGARLLIKSTVLNTKYVLQIASERLTAAGIDLDRVTLEGGSNYDGYLRRMRDVDIMLDSYPYVGGGTTCDALYMGVPVISLAGARHGTRFGLSFLSNVGAEELCASSAEEYINKAIELANDFDRLERYHRTLRSAMEQSPLMDAAAYMSDVETEYRRLIDAR